MNLYTACICQHYDLHEPPIARLYTLNSNMNWNAGLHQSAIWHNAWYVVASARIASLPAIYIYIYIYSYRLCLIFQVGLGTRLQVFVTQYTYHRVSGARRNSCMIICYPHGMQWHNHWRTSYYAWLYTNKWKWTCTQQREIQDERILQLYCGMHMTMDGDFKLNDIGWSVSEVWNVRHFHRRQAVYCCAPKIIEIIRTVTWLSEEVNTTHHNTV